MTAPRCSFCRRHGHYRRTCFLLLPDDAPRFGRNVNRCSLCDLRGHNYLTCPTKGRYVLQRRSLPQKRSA